MIIAPNGYCAYFTVETTNMTEKEKMNIPLLPDFTYRIQHEGINSNLIFFTRDNYDYFLKKYEEYSEGYWDTIGFVLMCNRYELIISVKYPVELLIKAQDDLDRISEGFYRKYIVPWAQENRLEVEGDLLDFKNLVGLLMYLEKKSSYSPENKEISSLDQVDFYYQLCSYIVTERFRRFQAAYTKAINKQLDRTGNLFSKQYNKTIMVDEKMVATHLNEVLSLKPNFGDEDFDYYVNSNSIK